MASLFLRLVEGTGWRYDRDFLGRILRHSSWWRVIVMLDYEILLAEDTGYCLSLPHLIRPASETNVHTQTKFKKTRQTGKIIMDLGPARMDLQLLFAIAGTWDQASF